jgi:serine/threonine protein kinase
MSGADDDKTVLVSRTQAAAAAADAVASDNALPPGTQLAEFQIVGLIGEGGFGIVYLAYDTQLGRNVALKEYFPGSLATRVRETQVTVKSTRHEETLAAGLRSFVNEARLLAQFDHHSLVNVYRFWEANGTAYMVMPYYDGVTLKDTLRQMGAPPSEAWLRGLLAPVIEALGVLHGVQCYHRDIAPDNIMLLKGSGRPVLLDFGAARRVISDMSQALTVILKPGFAPVEQYAAVASMKQGPWTDIYALAAVVYCAIQGTTPPASVGRLMSDSYVPLAEAAAGRYSDAFLRAIDHGLAVRPTDRPQSVEAFANELGLDIAEHPSRGSPASRENAGAAGVTIAATTTVSSTESRTRTAAMPPLPVPPVAEPKAPLPAAAPPAARVPRTAMFAVGAVVVAALAGTFGWRAMHSGAPAVSATRPSPAVVPRPDTAASTALAQSASEAPSAVIPAGTVTQSAALAPAPPPADVLPAFTPALELERVVALSDPSIHVAVTLRADTARVDKDQLQFRITSNRAGYLYVFNVDPDGQYLMIFPNKLDSNNAIRAGQTLALPRSNWPMMAARPLGANRFLALVSPARRDFTAGGLQQSDVFAGFSANAQHDGAVRRTATYSPFAGEPRCKAGTAGCTPNFGAATFEIDVVSGAAVPVNGLARSTVVSPAGKRVRPG